jgi:hypothetical protein
VADGIAEVVLGEEHLGDAAAEAVEGVVVERHEARLADCSAGLDLLESARTRAEAEAFDAKTNGTGADDENVGPAATKGGDLLNQTAEQAERDLAIGTHDDIGAEFDNDAAHA